VTNFWVTGKSTDIATSAEAMRELGKQYIDEKPEVADLCRLVIAVVTTRSVYHTIENSMVNGRVHPSVSMKQSTGRWSLTRPGLTVLGKRGGRYREREVLRADPGHVIIACDLSQVDMRAIAGLSGDLAYIELLRSGDPHSEIAKALFGTAEQREEAKKIGHGWNYGRGVRGICETYDLAPELVRRFDTSMHERFPRLVEWREEVRDLAGSGELLNNGWGRRMRPDPTRAHTQGPALMGQGCARDIMMEGLLRLPAEVLPMLRAQVHDEVVLSVPRDIAVDIQRAVIDALSFNWQAPSGEVVPIVAEGGPVDRESWGAVYAK
jgi:DNA polymerase-1